MTTKNMASALFRVSVSCKYYQRNMRKNSLENILASLSIKFYMHTGMIKILSRPIFIVNMDYRNIRDFRWTENNNPSLYNKR